MLRATTACTFSTCQFPKAVRAWGVLYIFTWKCASCHSGVHFFDISTCKSAPRPSVLSVFNTFDFETCALRHNGVHFFDISASKSGPNMRCFVHFDFQMCFVPQLRATFHLSSGQTALRPPLSNQSINTVFRDILTISRTCIFFLLTLLSSALLFSDSSHLCFSICPYCRKFDF